MFYRMQSLIIFNSTSSAVHEEKFIHFNLILGGQVQFLLNLL